MSIEGHERVWNRSSAWSLQLAQHTEHDVRCFRVAPAIKVFPQRPRAPIFEQR
ncbi:hypothetical protein SAMN05880561_103435 [Rhizobium sp. RU33A]|nr:hypothetical protein SAMN05880561_103435 [Rhizobium sp. RU33A]